ncbi:MAG: hypothetical protein M3Q63_02675 [bacterium]|nr:hypothetical protein [bacterium]
MNIPFFKKICNLKIILIVSLLSIPGFLNAAEFQVEVSNPQSYQGGLIKVDVYVDSGGENINTIEASIEIPSHLFRVSEVLSNDSIITLWIEKPLLVDAHPTSSIHFIGLIPGGFNELRSPYGNNKHQAKILSFYLQPLEEGIGTITIKNPVILRNDGLGTPLDVKNTSVEIKSSKPSSIMGTTIPSIIDNEAPDHFAIELGRDESLYRGRWIIAFNAQDKGSGIDHYEVSESRNDTHDWIKAQSPYVLRDQDLKSAIYVKAIDKKGNIRIESYPPTHHASWYEISATNYILVLITMGLVYLSLRLYVRKKIF